METGEKKKRCNRTNTRVHDIFSTYKSAEDKLRERIFFPPSRVRCCATEYLASRCNHNKNESFLRFQFLSVATLCYSTSSSKCSSCNQLLVLRWSSAVHSSLHYCHWTELTPSLVEQTHPSQVQIHGIVRYTKRKWYEYQRYIRSSESDRKTTCWHRRPITPFTFTQSHLHLNSEHINQCQLMWMELYRTHEHTKYLLFSLLFILIELNVIAISLHSK